MKKDPIPRFAVTLELTRMEIATIIAALAIHADRTQMEDHVRPIIKQVMETQKVPVPVEDES